MTPAAVEAELAVVYVVGSMTVRAPAPQPGLCGEGAPMTGVALHVEVRALQGEVRLPVVVELPFEPVHRVVAQGAVLREAIGVRIAFAMALGTLHGCVAENM